jgi:LacI family transcriptional regulator
VKSESRRIALLIGQDVGFCRDMIRGIRAYAIDKRNWVFQNGPPESSVVEAFRQWKPHGIIGQLLTANLARQVLRLRKPLVDTSCSVPRLRVPLVDADHQAVGRMAAEHFLERGYRHFGFFGSPWAHYSKLREAAFRQRLAEAGHSVSACYVEYLLRAAALIEWKQAAGRVRRWLQRLPKPVAIVAANDIPARELADTCRRIGLRVPDDVALLGIDNDDLECGLASPPLSSVATPARRIGYEAARLLDELMAGKPPPREPIFLPPVAVVTRQSTDTLAIHDAAVVAAMRFIRGHAADEIRVDDVARHAVQGRRMLEYKFRGLVGHTILEEIRRVRVQRVKQLLTDTDLSMPAIARRSGFSTPQRMAVVFRQLTGLTPSAYRQQAEVRDRGRDSSLGSG